MTTTPASNIQEKIEEELESARTVCDLKGATSGECAARGTQLKNCKQKLPTKSRSNLRILLKNIATTILTLLNAASTTNKRAI
jgi:hypothetical protein